MFCPTCGACEGRPRELWWYSETQDYCPNCQIVIDRKTFKRTKLGSRDDRHDIMFRMLLTLTIGLLFFIIFIVRLSCH